jgi:hypothetical protein
MKKRRTNLDPETAQKVLAADLGNLLAKVKSGKPLSRFERELIERAAGTSTNGSRPMLPPEQPHFARNASELADALGVTRQLLCFHRGKPDAPRPREDGRLDVEAWRTYFEAHGKLPTLLKLANRKWTRSRGRGTWAEAFTDGLLAAFDHSTSAALQMLAVTLPTVGLRPTPAQSDRIAVALWLAAAAAAHALAAKAGCADSPLLPDSDGKTFPPEIAGAAARIGIDMLGELQLAGFKPAQD